MYYKLKQKMYVLIDMNIKLSRYTSIRLVKT